MFKKFLVFSAFFLAGLVTLLAPGANAAQEQIIISSFVRDDCKHCQDQKEFFDELDNEYDIEFVYYDIYEEESNALFQQVTSHYGVVKGTPVTLVRDQLIQGFDSPQTTGEQIRKIIEEGTGEYLRVEDILSGGATVANGLGGAVCTEEECVLEDPSFMVRIPFTNKTIDVGKYSLGVMALVLGFVDGFNPCALWVLIMFLLVLSQLGSRKKMWQYAGIFILAEAIMYYLILNVWFTAWDFIALNNIVTPLVGILALGSGAYFLYKFATYKPVCNVTNPEQQKKLSAKVKLLASKPMTIGVFFGILGLAFSVNIFEFACSIGIPQTFTKILELNGMGWWGRQWYMFLYILMYMVDDVIVFGIALYSIDKIGMTHKYSKWATLIGGLFMLALGFIMLLNPELLVF